MIKDSNLARKRFLGYFFKLSYCTNWCKFEDNQLLIQKMAKIENFTMNFMSFRRNHLFCRNQRSIIIVEHRLKIEVLKV